MTAIPGLPPEVELSARTIGLLDEDGDLNAGWFQSPDSQLRTIIADPAQRAALLALLDAVLPPENLAGLRDGEK